MERRTVLKGISAGLAAGSMGLTTGRAFAAKTPIRIGGLIALSGPAAGFGQDEKTAVEVVAKQINQSGGIDGHPIELIIRDTKTNPTESARLANQLIRDEKVVAIIGATTGSETLAFADAATRAKVPLLPMVATPSVTDPEKEYFKWVFRSCCPLKTDLAASFKRLVTDGHKRMAVFHEEDAYGEQGNAMLIKLARDSGVELVLTASAPKAATDLTTPATRIRNANANAIVMVTSSTSSAGVFLRKVKDVGLEIPVYGVAGLIQRQLITSAGASASAMISPAMVNPDDPGPLTELFGLLKDHGGVNGFGALCGANAMAAVIAALKTGARSGAEIRDALETVGPIKGYGAAPIRYSATDHDGWDIDGVFFVGVKNGKFVNL